MSDKSQVSQVELHELFNDPSTLTVEPGVTLTDLQRRHVAVVLDLFQAKGTMAKLKDNFAEDAAYEDMVAISKNREEVAGQLVMIPTITSSTKTHHYSVLSVAPSTQTTTGTDRPVTADEIRVAFNHDLIFPAPLLPEAARTLNINTTMGLHINTALRTLQVKSAQAVVSYMLPRDDKEDAEKVLKEQSSGSAAE